MSKYDELIRLSKLANESYDNNEIDEETVKKIFSQCLKEYRRIQAEENSKIKKDCIGMFFKKPL
ncbi:MULTISPECIES: hypothetical protein [Flavobacterium]|uniref:Uncharacterized protein n=2 Tax=Flavobacterium TaxID=237 RepID=A0AA94JNJ3_9FLAO|nr:MULTISPECIES: hypothetical protein [Flavobacterium]OXA73986.1 hypothetical protein B0A56_13025 [Flavobacterium columnare NBRC 100251 = ATCC 23463]AMA49066.1 hypothetical protein AWN65_06145 [Flavobacterium covae]AND64860.1 hypothetical protein AX766_10875 [Flavobacterium covae]MCH4830999.1 hypothetical protein [Flavobacterium columnare]MCH4833060.1 hypothetical protein [Flavobacterium columnare]